MKLSNGSRLISLSLMMMLIVFGITSCSSDKDEPENPNESGSGVNEESMIPYSELPGTWLIESIKDAETGKSTAINQVVTIGKFEVSQEHAEVETINGYQYWTEAYYDILSYDNVADEDATALGIDFCKPQNKGLGSSMISGMMMRTECLVDDEGNNQIQVFIMSDLHLSGNVLTAKESSYTSLPSPFIPQIYGTITMKKL